MSKRISFAMVTCAYRVNDKPCGLTPGKHGVEFNRWNVFTKDCQVAHPFVISGYPGKAGRDE